VVPDSNSIAWNAWQYLVHFSAEVGDKELCFMVGKNAHDYSFRKKDQAVTLACKMAVRLTEGNIQVDPQLLPRD